MILTHDIWFKILWLSLLTIKWKLFKHLTPFMFKNRFFMINSSSKGDSEASRKLSLLTERLTVEKLTIYAMMNGDKNCVAKPKFKYLN